MLLIEMDAPKHHLNKAEVCGGRVVMATARKAPAKGIFLSWAVYHDSLWWHCLPKYYQIISNPSLGVWLPPGAKMRLLLLGEIYCSKLFLLFPQVWEERC